MEDGGGGGRLQVNPWRPREEESSGKVFVCFLIGGFVKTNSRMAGPEPTSYGGLIRKVIWMVGVSELLPLLAQKLKISLYRMTGGLASSSPFWRWAWLLPLRWVSYELWPLSRSSVQKVRLRGISSGYLGGGMSRPHCLFHPIPGLPPGKVLETRILFLIHLYHSRHHVTLGFCVQDLERNGPKLDQNLSFK